MKETSLKVSPEPRQARARTLSSSSLYYGSHGTEPTEPITLVTGSGLSLTGTDLFWLITSGNTETARTAGSVTSAASGPTLSL